MQSPPSMAACRRRGRRRRRTPLQACVSRRAVAPAVLSPAHRACARSRQRSARRCVRRPAPAGPSRPQVVPAWRARLRARCRCQSPGRRQPAHSRSGIRRPAAAGSQACGREIQVVSFSRKAIDAGIDQANPIRHAVAVAADCHNPQAALARRVDHRSRMIMIGGNHRNAIGCDQFAEQPELGGKIMRHIGVVIHVVARQVGEPAGAVARRRAETGRARARKPPAPDA